ncbi:MAG: tetratricopeptide repeat protein [Lachnospiraceae bacterium]|nr:tetratricopeptide repeat protein [Lachnospiraceae bacterium]
MDRYEYNIKSDQIKKLYSRKEFAEAAKVADEIDWYRVKDNVMINRVADIYENTKQYDKAKEILLIAYERSPLGRQLAYKLTILALRTKNFEEAEEFYQDFVEMSPTDVSKYLLKYRIAKAKGERAEVLIKILEEYVNIEMDERWQYELAKLYHEAGQDDKCIAMCNELELWFNEGKYVEKAKELKKLISGILEEYNRIYASDMNISYKPREKQVELFADKENDLSDKEEYSSMKSLAEAIVTNKDIEKAEKEAEKTAKEEARRRVREQFEENPYSEKVVEEDITDNSYENNNYFDDNTVESFGYEESEEEKRAMEALKAAEQAAIEAQKAADLAKKLVEEARLKANSFNKPQSASEYRTPRGRGSDKYAGMTVEEIRRQMDIEDGIYDVDEDSTIEIYEFDKKKEGKGRIGDELTKTAEIDIDEIKINLSSSNELYNTANIQEALAKSMQKLMGFSADTDDVTEEKTIEELTEEEVAEEKVLEEEVTEEKVLEEEVTEEEVTEEKVPEEEVTEEEVTEEKVLEEEEAVTEEISESISSNDPTKRIDRDEINRILNEIGKVQTSTEEAVEEKEDQIEGQMTLDDVFTQFNESGMEQEEKIEEATEDITDTIENEIDEVEEENSDEVKEDDQESESEQTKSEETTKEETVEASEESQESVVTETDITYKSVKGEIPENYRKLFNDFVGVGTMEEVISKTLDNLINKFDMDGTSKTNNVIVTGSSKVGKTTLGLSIIKAANKGRDRSGRKVAKVKATALNKRGVSLAMTQILGTDLIIEQAGNLMPNTVVDLMIAMKNYTEEMLIVLEDDRAAIDRLLENQPDLKNFFTNRLDIEEMEINDMLRIAKEYAMEQFYEIDEMGELALCAKLDDISGRDPIISIEDIQEVIDEAIEHANKLSIKGIFGKFKKAKGEMRTLTEQDFL